MVGGVAIIGIGVTVGCTTCPPDDFGGTFHRGVTGNVAVGGGVAVFVGVAVAVGVRVLVRVGVDVRVDVAVGVGVFVGTANATFGFSVAFDVALVPDITNSDVRQAKLARATNRTTSAIFFISFSPRFEFFHAEMHMVYQNKPHAFRHAGEKEIYSL